MTTIRDHAPADRYLYDFKFCTPDLGWAQVDTSSDAWYHGIWANPEKLWVMTYCEGELSLQKCDTPEEFTALLRSIRDSYNQNGAAGFKGIDAMCVATIEQRFAALGLGDMLH